MKFQKGDLVWVGWTPEKNVPLHPHLRLKQGEIVGYGGIWNLRGIGDHSCWVVNIEGLYLGVAEYLLTKISPEEHGRHEEKEDKEPAETVFQGNYES